MTYGNGTYDFVQYDGKGRVLSTDTRKDIGGVTLRLTGYTYDKADRITQLADTNDAGTLTTTTYGYDNAN